VKPLSETDLYVLFQEQEEVFLFDKDSNKEIWRTDMHGNATCGLIAFSNEWVVCGGHKLIIWKNNRLRVIEDPEIQWIHDIRQVGKNDVEILTDPWRDESAIWSFNIMTEMKVKVRDFQDYKAKEYTDNVIW
jgi:hypothetical protein